MFHCTTLHDSYSIQNCDKAFTCGKYLQKCHGLIMCLCQLIYNVVACVQNIHHQLSCFVPHVPLLSMVASTMLLQCCAKRVAGIVTIYYADMMSDDIVGIQGRELSSNSAERNYHLRCRLFWLISMNLCKKTVQI